MSTSHWKWNSISTLVSRGSFILLYRELISRSQVRALVVEPTNTQYRKPPERDVGGAIRFLGVDRSAMSLSTSRCLTAPTDNSDTTTRFLP